MKKGRERIVERNRVRKEMEKKGYYLLNDIIYPRKFKEWEFVLPIGRINDFCKF